MPDKPLASDDEPVELDRNITRKNFLNTTLLGMGAALLHMPAPAESNGNMRTVMDAAYRLRDGAYKDNPSTTDTGELFDVVIVGGGLSGLSAAYYYAQQTGGGRTALVLENHSIFGGEAKQNEFVVDGVRMIGPQGSNDFGVPRAGSPSGDLWDDLKMPREFAYQDWDASLEPMRFPLDSSAHMDGVNEFQADVGYFFDEKSGAARGDREGIRTRRRYRDRSITSQ